MNLDKNNNMDFEKSGGQQSSGMKVPDGYFENFEDSILAKIKEDANQTKVVPIETHSSTVRIWTIIAVAASLIWAAFWVFTPENEVENKSLAVTEISVDDFEYYTDADAYLLTENISATELENIELNEDYVSSEEIYEYILNEGISEFTLTENF